MKNDLGNRQLFPIFSDFPYFIMYKVACLDSSGKNR